MELKQEYYTMPEVANILGVARMSPWNWVQKGKIKTYSPHSSVILVSKKEVLRIAKERGIV